MHASASRPDDAPLGRERTHESRAREPGTHAPRLRARALEKRYGSTLALAAADLELARGEIHALLGENGAGKSTLVRCIAGAEQADGGALELDGAPWRPRSPAEARAGGVAVIWQELALAADLSIEDNLLLGREVRRGPFVARARTRSLARAALARAGLAELAPQRRVADFDIATRQRIELARALVGSPRLIALDEPTSSLGPAEITALHALLRELAHAGVAILYIAHDLGEQRAVASRCTVLRDGASVDTAKLCERSDDELVRAMVGRAVGDLYPRKTAPRSVRAADADRAASLERPQSAGRAARSIEDPLEGHGESLVELRDVTTGDGMHVRELDLRRGEVLGIAGLIGAGRSELLRALHGSGAALRGDVRVLARVGAATPAQRWRDGSGLASEDRRLEGLMQRGSVAANVALPRLHALARAGWISLRATHAHAAPWRERLALRCRDLDQAVAELSGGNQQKVQLARLLAADCDVLWLDEPTRGVDVVARAEIYRCIDALARPREPERARAIVLVSSSLPELFGTCDRIAVAWRTHAHARDGASSSELLAPKRVAELTPEHVLAAAAGGAW